MSKNSIYMLCVILNDFSYNGDVNAILQSDFYCLVQKFSDNMVN